MVVTHVRLSSLRCAALLRLRSACLLDFVQREGGEQVRRAGFNSTGRLLVRLYVQAAGLSPPTHEGGGCAVRSCSKISLKVAFEPQSRLCRGRASLRRFACKHGCPRKMRSASISLEQNFKTKGRSWIDQGRTQRSEILIGGCRRLSPAAVTDLASEGCAPCTP